ELRGSKRRSAFQIHGSHIVCRELRDTARSGRVLGEAFQRRARGSVRLAERQIWSVVANRAHDLERANAGQGSPEIAKGHAGFTSNEETGYRRFEEGLRGEIGSSSSAISHRCSSGTQ